MRKVQFLSSSIALVLTWAPVFQAQQFWPRPQTNLPQTINVLDASRPVQVLPPSTSLYTQTCMVPPHERRPTGLERAQEAKNPFFAPLRDLRWREGREEREKAFCAACKSYCTGDPPKIKRIYRH